MTDPSAHPQQSGIQRDPIVAAFMAVMADKRFEDIGFAEIARRAGVSLSELPASTPPVRDARRLHARGGSRGARRH